MKKRIAGIAMCAVLAGCSAASSGGSNDAAVYETYDRSAVEADIMDGTVLERYAAVSCEVVEVKILSQEEVKKTVSLDGIDEDVNFTHYTMSVSHVICAETLSKGDEVTLAVADWMSEEYPPLKEGMTYVIPVYQAEEDSANAGCYLVADYSLFYVMEDQDGTENIRAAYVEDQAYDGLSIEEFKARIEDALNVVHDQKQ